MKLKGFQRKLTDVNIIVTWFEIFFSASTPS